MIAIVKLVPQGRGLAGVLLRRAATVELDWDLRQKSRLEATDSTGRALAIFLPRGSCLRGGDVLVAEDGSLVVVKAAAQAVLVVRPCSDHGAPSDLLRAAYHLGNRHVAVELQPDHLKLEPDHVLAAMLRRMHLIVTEARESFEPEAGAYGGAQGDHGAAPHDHDHHGHDHQAPHDHDHQGHDHQAPHAHDHHGHDHQAPHAHGHDGRERDRAPGDERDSSHDDAMGPDQGPRAG